jgi:hypothetical protein
MERRHVIAIVAAMVVSCGHAPRNQDVVIFSEAQERTVSGEPGDAIATACQSLLAETTAADIGGEFLTRRSYEDRRRTQFGTEVFYATPQSTAGLTYDRLLVVYDTRGDDPAKYFTLVFASGGTTYTNPPRIAGDALELRALLTKALSDADER